MLTLILAVCCLGFTILAVVVLYANYRNSSNRWLGGFALGALLWLLANLLANNASNASTNLLFSRLTLVGAALLPLTYLFFCVSFTRARLSRVTRLGFYMPVALLLATLPTKLYIASISPDGKEINPGIAYGALLLVLTAYFTYGTVLLVGEYRRSKQMRRRQLYYILLGTILTVVPAMTLSAVLPLLGYSQGVEAAPALSIIFALFTTVAILKHHLFDIRFFVVRAATYGFTTLLVSLFYALPAVWVLTRLSHVHLSVSEVFELAIVLLVLAVLYRYVIRWFDHLTKHIFYRNYYDPQDVLDRFGNLLAHTIETDRLQQESKQIIIDTLNVSFVEFWLEGSAAAERAELLFGQGFTQNVLLLDDDTLNHREVIDRLKQDGIAVIVQLRTTRDKPGYIALGAKKSGELFSEKDTRLLNTIADELAISFQNALHFEEIQNFNLLLQERVGKATSQLRRSNHRLRELDSTKDDFISMASHQLRTPLTSVKGYLSMVLEGDAGELNNNQRKLLEQSYRSSQQMVFLISDLLNLSRLNTGKFVIEPTPVDLSELVQFEVGQLEETARSRNISLKYERPAKFPSLMLDETKIHQVVMNFIDNAIYYTPSGGTVTIALRETPGYVEYTVKDTGIGVPKDAQRKLFSKFFRADNAQKARPDGTGLGLFMAKKVVAAQGGALIFESEEGKGSTFGFRFNKAKHVVSPPGATDTKAALH